MKKFLLLVLCLSIIFLFPVSINAAGIDLPDLIGNHMIIQQAKPIKLWGTVAPGETVSISLRTIYKTVSREVL